MNRKVAAFGGVHMNCGPLFAISSAKQGNPKTISSFTFQTTNDYSSIPRFRFEDIRNPDDAATMFDQMIRLHPKPPTLLFNKLFTIILKMEYFSQLILLFKKFTFLGCPVDDYTMNILINCYCRLKTPDLGFTVLPIFFKLGYTPDIVSVNSLIKGLYSEGRVGEAHELFEKLIKYKLCEMNNVTLSVVFDGLCKSRSTMKAVEMLEVLEKENYELNVYVYNTVINGLCKSRKVDDAMPLLSRMIDRGILPDVVTCTTLIHGLCNICRLVEAKKLLKQMVTEWSVHPNVITYNGLIIGYCLQGHPDKAKEVIDLMVDRGVKPDVVSYGTIVIRYCKQKKIDHAWTMFSDMRQKGLKPDAPLYCTMMKGLFSVSRCSDALKLFGEMKIIFHYMDVNTYYIVLNGLLSNGLIEDAKTVFHEKEREGSACHIDFYTIFIHGLCIHRQLGFACSIFNNLSSKGLYPNVRTYTVMIQGYCQEGLHQEAKELLEKMEQSGCLPNNVTYNVIIQGCVVHRDSEYSVKLLKLIIDWDFPIDSYTFTLLLQQMSQSSDDSAMRSLIQKLILKDEAQVMT